jgi:hypothetical protein
MGCKVRPVLTPELGGHDGGQTAQDLILGIHQDPFPVYIFLANAICLEGVHAQLPLEKLKKEIFTFGWLECQGKNLVEPSRVFPDMSFNQSQKEQKI